MKKNKPDISLLRKYLKGELDDRAMYDLERQAQDDPLFMDVMLGVENGSEAEDTARLNEISMLIKKRVGEREAGGERSAEPVQEPIVRKLFPWKTWMAAASLVTAFFMAGLWFFRTPKDVLPSQIAVLHEKTDSGTLPKIEDSKPVPEMKTELPLDALAANKPVRAKTIENKKAVSVADQIPAMMSAAVPAATALVAADKKVTDTVSAAGNLNEVIVNGYAAVQKKAVTASSVQVKSDTINRVLLGKVAGVRVDPFRLRGSFMVSGVVNDKEDRSPLPGVAVRLKDEVNLGTITDSKGRFSLVLPSKDAVLNFTAIGYDGSEVRVKSKDSLNIALEPNRSALSEVVVAGMNSKVKPKKAQPEIGWKAYNEYLEAQALIQSGGEGKVTLTFTLDERGRPVFIKILKGVNAELDVKAIKIIADGPVWSRDEAEPAKEIILKIKFHK